MKRDPALGNAFMDVALAGAILSTMAIFVAVISGDDVNLGLLGVGIVTYGAYLIGALRLGVSPVAYLRNLTKRPR
jgi:hypothetical protein